MSLTKFGVYNTGCFIVIVIAILVCIWNIALLFIPMQILLLIFLFNHENECQVKFTIFDLILVSLLLFEIINLLLSSYKCNGTFYLFEFITVVYSVIIVNKLFEIKKYKFLFLIFISSIALCMSLFNIIVFLSKYYELMIYDFYDFSQFRYLYKPMGILSNEWVTALLCFLPFPIIGLFMCSKSYQKHNLISHITIKWIQCIFTISILTIIFNIFISFSRAAFLSFLFWLILINIFFLFFKLIKLKIQLLLNLLFVLFVLIFVSLFLTSIYSTVYSSNSHKRSTESRITQWENSLKEMNCFSLTGIGSKNYPLISSKWQDKKHDSTFSGRINNTYLQLLLEKGIVGFVLWSFLIMYFIIELIRVIIRNQYFIDTIRSSILLSTIIAILIRELFFSSLFYNSGILLLFLLLLSLIEDRNGFNILLYRNAIYVYTILLLLFYFMSMYSFSKYNEYLSDKNDNTYKQSLSTNIIDNSLLFAAKGLNHERNKLLYVNWSSIVNRKMNYSCDKEILMAVIYYEKACEINPYDPVFYHNLSWLYFLSNQYEKALLFIEKAIDYSYNTSLYHISKGLILECIDLDKSMTEYEIAIVLSPDICETDFFLDFSYRNETLVLPLLNNVLAELKAEQLLHYSSITEAKIGKIMLSLGMIDEAYRVLSGVTKIHPSLNRPWYYLGIIENYYGNDDFGKNDFEKSFFLNRNDYLPLYALSDYYKYSNDSSSVNKYVVMATNRWNKKQSVHASRSSRIYNLNTIVDDIIPKGLLDYTSPKYKTNND